MTQIDTSRVCITDTAKRGIGEERGRLGFHGGGCACGRPCNASQRVLHIKQPQFLR
jgi:hypothetical protein